MVESGLAYGRRRDDCIMQTTDSIFVTGKTGQLARSMTELARERKLPLVSIGRPEFDLVDPTAIERTLEALRPRAIVNAAAYTLVDKAEAEPDLAFKVNRDGAAHLARLSERLGVPFIHISTDYVFDGNKRTSYQEDDKTAPINVYGSSKRAGEIAVLDSYASAIVIRTSWVYSPYGQNFVKTMLRLAETRDHVRVVNDQKGSPTYAPDLADAILEILNKVESESARNFGGLYHLAASGDATWYEFAAAIFAELAKTGRRVPTLEPITTAEYPTPARRPLNSVLNCSKIHRVFDTRLPDWQHGLDRCLAKLAVVKKDEL